MKEPVSEKPTLWDVIKSVFAAMFGVQSSKNRERDFKHGNIWIFVVVGLVATTLFVVGLYLLVRGVISAAG